MSAAHALLRDLWCVGVRVRLMQDRLRLDPPGVTPAPLRLALLEYRAELKALLAALPARDRCQVCGSPTRGPKANTGHIHCTICALIVADRRGWRVLSAEEIPDAA